MQNNSKEGIINKNLPGFQYLTTERNQKFFGLVLTLCALSFFGFFAIKPTISTILELQKEVKDNQYVLNQIDVKIENLTQLGEQYSNLKDDIPVVTNAVPMQPDAPILFAQIQSIAQTSDITIKKLQNFEVEIIRNDKEANKNYYSYSFSVAGSGSFKNISAFMQKLVNMGRVINIETFSINNVADLKNGIAEFDIKGTAFFKDSL